MKSTALLRLVQSVTLAAFITTSNSCGLLLYPERQGQAHGKIDLSVLFLDGLGTLLWVVPGVTAFVVDFNQGTIYLPDNSATNSNFESSFKQINVQAPMTMQNIEEVLKTELDLPINLDDERALVYHLKDNNLHLSPEYMSSLLAQNSMQLKV